MNPKTRTRITGALLAGVALALASGVVGADSRESRGFARDGVEAPGRAAAVLSLLGPPFETRSTGRSPSRHVRVERRRVGKLNRHFRRAVEQRRPVRLAVELFPGTRIIAVQRGVHRRADGFTWYGSADSELGDVILTVVGDRLRGTVHFGDREYLLTNDARGGIEVTEIALTHYAADERAVQHAPNFDFSDVRTRDLPSEGYVQPEIIRVPGQITAELRTRNAYGTEPPPFEAAAIGPDDLGITVRYDDGNVIDVLPIVSSGAVAWAGSEDALALIFRHALDRTNLALYESGAHAFLYMLPPRRIPGTVFADPGDELAALIDPADQVYDYVHGWRDEDAADLMVVVGGPDAFPGIHGAAVTRTEPVVVPVYAERAFAIFNVDSLSASSNIFSHEIAHMFGIGHDWFSQGQVEGIGFHPADYRTAAHGYATEPFPSPQDGQPQRYLTLVAYNTKCLYQGPAAQRCHWIPRYSNANHYLMFLGTPFGSYGVALGTTNPLPADAVQTINWATPQIAGHRHSVCRSFPTAPKCP